MSRPQPSFFSHDWHTPAGPRAPVAVRFGRRAGDDVDLDQVRARCDGLLTELSAMMGLDAPHPCTADRTDHDSLVEVDLLEHTRLVAIRAAGPHSDRCGFAVGLGADARAGVLAVERVFLDEPSLLLAAGATPRTWWLPVPEVGADLDLVSALVDRGVSLLNVTAAALAYADGADPRSNASDISTWLNDFTVGVEVVEDVDDDLRREWPEKVAGLVEGAPLGLGLVQLPATVRPPFTDAWAEAAPWLAGGHARLVVGTLPVGLLPDPFEVDADLTEHVHGELRRTAWRSVDEVTLTMRLDRLATFVPHTVRALRLVVDDRRLADLISAASRHVTVAELWTLADDLLEHGVPDDLLDHPTIGARLVERHLSAHLRHVPSLEVVEVDPALAGRVAAGESLSGAQGPADLVADLLRQLALIMPSTPWTPAPARAIVLDDLDARDAVRRAVRHQAPGVLVLTHAELPARIPRTTIGRLELRAAPAEDA